MIHWGRRGAATTSSEVSPELERQARIAAAAELSRRADAAITSSAAAVNVETSRLRSSREVAAALAEHIRQNGLTERIRLSMAPRESKA